MTDPLPAESRITSRVEKEALTITIPGPSRSWGFAAICAFLGVTFIAQGVLSGRWRWLAAALAGVLIAAWKVGRSLGFGTILRVDREKLSMQAGLGESPQRSWLRQEVSDISIERRGSLRLDLKHQPPARLRLGLKPEELKWVIGQIRNKWNTPEA